MRRQLADQHAHQLLAFLVFRFHHGAQLGIDVSQPEQFTEHVTLARPHAATHFERGAQRRQRVRLLQHFQQALDTRPLTDR